MKKSNQTTSALLMVRPASFRMNDETAVNNYFQKKIEASNARQIKLSAQEEFDALVAELRRHDVEVVVVNDTELPEKPDALFPNNWISTHSDGTVVLYPMFAENRRLERRMSVLDLLEENGFEIKEVLDYTSAEEEEIFLEGTGSMVLDRKNRKAYMGLSVRADEGLLEEFCDDMEFVPVVFEAFQTIDGKRKPIYHTNVMMSVADDFAIVCLDAVDDVKEKKQLVSSLKDDGKEIVSISEDQMKQFAGNTIAIHNKAGKKLLLMSTKAYNAFTIEQKECLKKYVTLCHAPLEVIETCGGGGARCMVAEVFLPKV